MRNKKARKVVNRLFSAYYIGIAFFVLILFIVLCFAYYLYLRYLNLDTSDILHEIYRSRIVRKLFIRLPIRIILIFIAMFELYLKSMNLFFTAQKDLIKNLISSKEITVTKISNDRYHKTIFTLKYCIFGSNFESFIYCSKSGLDSINEIQSLDQFITGEVYKITYLTNSKIIFDVEKISKLSTVEKETNHLDEITEWEQKAFDDVCEYLLQNKGLFEDNNLSCLVYLYSMHSLPNDDYTSNIWICPTKDGLVPIEVHSRKAPVVLFSLIFEIVTPKKIRQKNTVFQLKNDYIEQLESKLSTYISVFFTQQLEPLENQKGYNKDFKLKKQIF